MWIFSVTAIKPGGTMTMWGWGQEVKEDFLSLEIGDKLTKNSLKRIHDLKYRFFSGPGDSILHLLKYLLRSQGTKYSEQYLFHFILIGTKVTRGYKRGEKNPCQLFFANHKK